ncbi:hypothetical protein [Nocardia albiluteola]|nr:hypothetical protein [Nocardia albiluteola]
MPLRSHTLLLLVAACAVVGALVTGVGPLRTTRVGLISALIGGQLLGHAVMSVDMAAMPGHASMWTPAMLAAHTVAALAAAVVIRGAEAAYGILAAAMARMLPLLLRAPAIPGPPSLRITHRDSVIQRILAADPCHTRGPPAPAGV